MKDVDGSKKKYKYTPPTVIGFKRGLDPEKIIGASDASGELMFLIKWKGIGEMDLVPSRECNIKCPAVVLQFYENNVSWKNISASSST